MFKFIGAIAGYILMGMNPVGAIVGFLIGYFIDWSQKSPPQNSGQAQAGTNQGDTYTYYRQQTSLSDFPTMLMVLSAAVMRADGKALKSEISYIKSFFNQQFGNQFTVAHLQALKYFLSAPSIPIDQICMDIRIRTQPDARVLLLHYLFGIANADGNVDAQEIAVLQRISTLLGIPQNDFESVKNMFYRNTDSDYKVLGLESSALDEDVRKAYRQMALKYHPDKVAYLGEEYQKRAKEKFQQIQEAYENIKKKRGMV